MKYLVLMILLASFNAFSCTLEEAMEAEDVAGYVNSWSDLEKAFEEYGHCDDGSIAAGFSESVSNLLAYNWRELSYLKNKPNLYSFVLHHIDETWGVQYKMVLINAKRNCPKFAQSICMAVVNLPAP